MMQAFSQLPHPLQALLATLFTWGITAAGAAVVFCCRNIKRDVLDGLLGASAGVMLAASFWSLLAPSIEMARQLGRIPWLPALLGLCLGALGLYAADQLMLRLERRGMTPYHTRKRTLLLIVSITLHNIPEGLAVGAAFGSLLYGLDGATLAAACMLALGIGIQNFPEGAAISLPMLRDGASKKHAFTAGMLSGAVEPIAGVIGALLVLCVRAALPYMLAFAGGAMIYVVVEELIPESHCSGKPGRTALFTLAGFALMMVLDVALSI